MELHSIVMVLKSQNSSGNYYSILIFNVQLDLFSVIYLMPLQASQALALRIVSGVQRLPLETYIYTAVGLAP